MILLLFGFFVAVALVLIVIGLTRPTESAQAIIGFLFLFLLSVFVVIPGNLEYEQGYIEYFVYGNNFSGYHWDYEDPLEPRPHDPDVAYLFHTVRNYTYKSFDGELGGTNFGIWLAIASAIGMIGVFFSIKNTRWRDE